jgi:hypothetical protein
MKLGSPSQLYPKVVASANVPLEGAALDTKRRGCLCVLQSGGSCQRIKSVMPGGFPNALIESFEDQSSLVEG